MTYFFVDERGNQAMFFIHKIIGLLPSVIAFVILSFYAVIAALLAFLICARYLGVTSWRPTLLSGPIVWALLFLTHSLAVSKRPDFREFIAFLVFYGPMIIIPLIGVFALVLRTKPNKALHQTGER